MAEIIPELDEVRQEESFDRARLQDYLREHQFPGADGPLHVRQFRGGHSNLTYLLSIGGQEWVLRRPPLGPLPKGGHDMAREYRVLSSLWQAYQPAPRAMLFCEDPAIIGAPFFIMERRKGSVIRLGQPMPPELGEQPQTFRAISEGFIDALAALHAVDYEANGLGSFGRPEGFLQRQIAGWMERWQRAKTREIPLMNKLGAWLGDNMPPAQPPVLLHNDFFLHNMMFDANDPGRVVAVFDWEMSTLGDPMIDLGIALGYWREKTDPPDLLATEQGQPHTIRPGFLSTAELAERYASKTGRDLSHLDYFWAWAHWKRATVVEQIYARYARGQTTDPRFAAIGPFVPALARAAGQVASRIGFRE